MNEDISDLPGDSEESDPDSIYGQEVPSVEEMEEELERAGPTPPPPPPETRPATSPLNISESRTTSPRQSRLQEALEGRNINDILPQLSPEERKLLELRYDLTTGQRSLTQAEASRQLGLSIEDFRNRENEILEQVYDLSGRDLPDAEKP